MASTNLSKDRSAIYFGQHWAEPFRTVLRQSRLFVMGRCFWGRWARLISRLLGIKARPIL
jgi:hypothetical protein